MATKCEQPTVLVVQSDEDGGPRRVGRWLEEAGIRLQVAEPYTGASLPERLDCQGLVVMGGGMLPYDDAKGPWLPRTRELARQAIEERIPMLGICLGGQMLAHVAGGRVEGNHGLPEFGSTQVELRPEARADPLFGALPDLVPAIEHHVDAITSVPSDVVWLAQSERCPYQAIRVGACAWGTQFHPEVTVEQVRAWKRDAIREAGFDRDELIARAETDEVASTSAWREMIGRFAEVIKLSHSGHGGQYPSMQRSGE